MISLAFDLDDTLLDRNKRIGPDTARVLRRWLDAGRPLFLATARPLRSVRRFVDADILARCYVVTLNGAVWQCPGQAPQAVESGLAEVVRSILAHNELCSLRLSIESWGIHFISNVHLGEQELAAYHNATPDLLLPISEAALAAATKIAIDGLGQHIDQHTDWLTRLGARVIPALDGSFLNVVAPEVDKSTTLAKLLHEQNLPVDKLAAFGDDVPDLGMLHLAGYKIAMGNACQALKAVAQHVLEDCDSDCIGRFVETQFMAA